MARFEQQPAAVIRQLQDLLRRYRGGFSIIKEFVQNADDAEATQVHIVWTPGIRDESHPLLRGPALIAINNGKCDARDEEAVRAAIVAVSQIERGSAQILRDWELLLELNRLAESRGVRTAPAKARPEESTGVLCQVDAALAILRAALPRMNLPFRVPEIQPLAILWPGIANNA
jgi:hypothetical protein